MFITHRSDLDPLDAQQIVLISFLWIIFFCQLRASIPPSIQKIRETCDTNAESLSCCISPNYYVSYMCIIEVKHTIFFLFGIKIQYKLLKLRYKP